MGVHSKHFRTVCEDKKLEIKLGGGRTSFARPPPDEKLVTVAGGLLGPEA
jgi:hypothetical protein